jgi:hypothetical protein
VSAEHPEEPGYVPNEVESAVVPFIDVQVKMTIEAVEGSTAAPASYWAGKWIAELYDLSLTAGCSENPPQYCPDMPVTRA